MLGWYRRLYWNLRWWRGIDQIAIVGNGVSWDSESGEPFPQDLPGWREFLEEEDRRREEQRGRRCPRRFRPR